MTSSGITSRLATSPVYGGYPVLQGKGQGESSTKIASTALAFYIFLLAGRALDVSPIWWLHIPMIMLAALALTTFARGNLQIAFSSKITKYFAAFTAWVFLCFPFSKWRAGSVMPLQWQIQSFLIFLIVVQLIKTKRDWEKAIGGFAYATLIAALLSFYFGYTVEGRTALPGGTLGDPNEFALLMVVGLPLWWFKASRATGFRKIFCLCCTVPILLAFARAGSRAGLISMAVLLALSFMFAKGIQKATIPIVALVAVALSSFLLPGYIRTRFMTFFSSDSGQDAYTQARIGSDIASSEGRKALLIQSIHMTFEHPIVGVGPGCFSFVAWDERKAATGAGGETLVSHNTYTQISSETGVPGFILFVTTLFLSMRSVIKDYRRTVLVNTELAQCARYLFTSISAMAVGIFFLSVGYTHMSATLCALALALHHVVETALKTSKPITETSGQQRSNRFQLQPSQYAVNRVVAGSAPYQRLTAPVKPRYRPTASSRQNRRA